MEDKRTWIDKKRVMLHFDRHAEEYDRYARVQRHMAQKLFHLASSAAERRRSQVRRILEIGCGTGFLTEALTGAYPEAEITAVDLSPAMIAVTREKLSERARRVRFVAGDAERLLTAGGIGRAVEPAVPFGMGDGKESLDGEAYDLIVSGAVFQWFNEPAATIKGALRLLRPGGILAFSTFGPKTFRELHASFRQAEDELGMPHAARGQAFLSAAEWGALFPTADGAWEWEEEERTERFPKVRDFLYSVKRVGAGNASSMEGQGVATGGRKLFSRMNGIYDSRFGGPDGIPATYHIGYGTFVLHPDRDGLNGIV